MASWLEVRLMLEGQPAGVQMALTRGSIAHPREEGAVRSLGWPRGQIADWRFPPTPTCRGLHVHEHPDRWVAHVDRFHPDCDPLGHLLHDAPQLLVGGAALVGAVAGVCADRRRGRGLTVGTTAGIVLGLMMISARSS